MPKTSWELRIKVQIKDNTDKANCKEGEVERDREKERNVKRNANIGPREDKEPLCRWAVDEFAQTASGQANLKRPKHEILCKRKYKEVKSKF